MELHSEQIARNSEQIAHHTEQIGQLIGQTGQLIGQAGQVTDLLLRTGRIVEAMAQQSDDRFARLDDRLNVLIGVVERIVSDGKHP